MDVTRINGKNYYEYREIQEHHSVLTKSCRTISVFLKKRKIPDNQWIYARLKQGKWVMSDGSSTKVDKMFVRMRYFDAHLAPEEDEEAEPEHPILPDPIALKKSEMFHDQDGKVIKIKVVGEKKEDGIYFCCKDVSVGFGLKHLMDTVTGKEGAYEEHEHYQWFSDDSSVNSGKCSRSVAYLTYEGVLKVLFSSRKKSTKQFRTWATKTLFTAQMGTAAQKRQLASDLTGISVDGIKNMCSVSAGIIVCIYLFALGTVRELRKGMEIDEEYDDDDLVCKFGKTNDLNRRSNEHAITYGNIAGLDLRLMYHGQIDVQHATKAEGEIAAVFASHEMMFSYQGSKEIVIIPRKKLAAIKKAYDAYISLNRGRVAEMVTLLEKKDHEIEMVHKDKALLEKDVTILQKDNEILRKDKLILQLQLEAAERSSSG